MRLILKPLGVVALMGSVTALAALAIYGTGPKPLPQDAAASADSATPAPTLSAAAASPAAASSAAAVADSSGTVPPITAALLDTTLSNWSLYVAAPAKATRTIVSDAATPNVEKRYLHAVVTAIDPKAFWIVQFQHNVYTDVPAGQDFVMRFVARSLTNNHVQIAFLRDGADHHSDLAKEVALTPAWKTYSFPFKSSRTYLTHSTDGAAAVCLHCGEQTGTVDMAALQVYPAQAMASAK